MQRKLKIIIMMIIATMVMAACGDKANNGGKEDNQGNNIVVNNEGDNNNNNENEYKLDPLQDRDAMKTPKGMMERVVAEMNKYKDLMIEDAAFHLSLNANRIGMFSGFELATFAEVEGHPITITVKEDMADHDFDEAEEFELWNGLVGHVGQNEGEDFQFFHKDNNIITRINIEDVTLTEGKELLQAVSIRTEDVTLAEINERIGLDMEKILYFDADQAHYELEEIWLNESDVFTGVALTYADLDGAADDIDITVRVKEPVEKEFSFSDRKSTVTPSGREVFSLKSYDNRYSFWQAEDGLYYSAKKSFKSDGDEDKAIDVTLEHIDLITKSFY